MCSGFRAVESDQQRPWKASEGTEELPGQHQNPQQQTHLRHVRCDVSTVCCVFCSLCVTFLCPFCRTHCNSQVLSQKQLCDERLAAAKLEYEKKLLKPAAELVRCFSLSTPSESKKRSENQTNLTFKPDLRSYTPPLWPFFFQESAPGAATKEEVKISTAASTMTNLSKPQVKEAAEILTNEITVGKGEDTKG